MSGRHETDDIFPVGLSNVLDVHFFPGSDSDYVSLHWSGDEDLDDTRIWVRSTWSGVRSDIVEANGAVCMAAFDQRSVIIARHDYHDAIFDRSLQHFLLLHLFGE